jgi:membrane protease YdiL (CAAX protease family)
MPYHLMLRTWSYSWWRPVLGVLIAVMAFFVGASLVYFAVAAGSALFEGGPWADDFTDNLRFDQVGPEALLGLNLGIASMIPVTWFIMRVVHRMRPRWLASVVPKMRWGFFGICLGIALLALIAQILVGMLLPGGTGDDLSGHLNDFTLSAVVSAVVVVLTTPLQAAGEEYLFRGYLLQAFGSFFRNRWVAILATATLFAIAHGGQNFPLFFDRFAFGVIAGWLVTRTGGLEAGIALHIFNNFLAFGIALTFGDLTATLTVSAVSWWNIVLTVTQSGVYTLLVVLVARKMDLQNVTRPPREPWEPSVGPAAATA